MGVKKFTCVYLKHYANGAFSFSLKFFLSTMLIGGGYFIGCEKIFISK